MASVPGGLVLVATACMMLSCQRRCRHYSCADCGRAAVADVVLEHPSSSRLHAVIQFKAGTGEAFLYDAASAHGTFLNKRRLKPRQHEPLR